MGEKNRMLKKVSSICPSTALRLHASLSLSYRHRNFCSGEWGSLRTKRVGLGRWVVVNWCDEQMGTDEEERACRGGVWAGKWVGAKRSMVVVVVEAAAAVAEAAVTMAISSPMFRLQRQPRQPHRPFRRLCRRM